jgi:sugar phosphate isomerase/epimerase
MNTGSVALQMYTVRDETARDFVGTLRRVAEMGYTAVEFAGYGGLSSTEMNKVLKEVGLKAISTHVGLPALEKDLAAQIEYCQDIGCPYLVLPWLDESRRNVEAIKQIAAHINEFGRQCHSRGITFGYHNHNFEFAQDNGKYLLDYLLEATDPSLVVLELDVYWAAYAGVDPSAYIRQHAGRIPLVHLKDMTPERTYTEVGDGTLKLDGIYKVARESGCQWFIVEHDQPTIPSLESAQRSLQNLQKMNI